MKIAFGCQARVGKDTACQYLQEKYGGVTRHFSDPLYEIMRYAQKTCNLPDVKDRRFLQLVGTEWGRAVDEDLWVKVLVDRLPKGANCYIGDLRFPNEFRALKDAGFKCVRIIRDERENDAGGHVSETALLDYSSKWDAVLFNNGTLEDFYQKLDAIVLDLKKAPNASNEHDCKY